MNAEREAADDGKIDDAEVMSRLARMWEVKHQDLDQLLRMAAHQSMAGSPDAQKLRERAQEVERDVQALARALDLVRRAGN